MFPRDPLYSDNNSLPLAKIRSFVTDSVSYLDGLVSPWDMPPAVFNHRNRMISKVDQALRCQEEDGDVK